MTPSRRIALPLRTLTAALALGLAGTAAAGVSYRLDRPSAAPGDTVTIEAVYFNEGNARATDLLCRKEYQTRDTRQNSSNW